MGLSIIIDPNPCRSVAEEEKKSNAGGENDLHSSGGFDRGASPFHAAVLIL
jgi:hypothetical protein